MDCFVAALLAMTAMPYDGGASRLRGEAMSQAATTGTPTTPPVLDRLFGLSKSGSTVRTEFVAGLTTFLTMVYIVFVNPQILGNAGMDKGAVREHGFFGPSMRPAEWTETPK